MKSNLGSIEQEFSEGLIDKADKLLYPVELLTFKKEDKHLWVFQFVIGTASYETELLLKPGVKAKYTCECKSYKSQSVCEHIVAALIKLQREKQKKVAKPRKKAISTSRNKYNFRTILDQAKTDDIKNFVQSYAKKNKDFSLAFKVHFASKTETGFDEDKYKRLLDEAVKAKNSRHPNLTKKEWSNFKMLQQDFLAQIQDNISQDQFKSAFIIIEKCLDKTAYIRTQFDKRFDSDLINMRNQLLGELKLLCKKDLAPALRSYLKDKLIENACKSYYHPELLNMVSIAHQELQFDTKQQQTIIDNFSIKLEQSNSYQDFKLPLILTMVKNDEIQLKKMIELHTPVKLLEALLKLQESKDFDLVKSILSNPSFSEWNMFQKHELILNDLAFRKKYKQFLKAAFKLVDFKHETKLTTMIINNLPISEADLLFEKFSKQMSLLNDSNEARLLSHYENYPQLFAIMKEQTDFLLIVNYDQILIENGYEEEVQELYKKMFSSYLDEHFGMPSLEKTQYILKHLSHIGAHKMKVKIHHFITKEYPNRNSLQQIIER